MANAIEYGLIAAMIAIVLISAGELIGEELHPSPPPPLPRACAWPPDQAMRLGWPTCKTPL